MREEHNKILYNSEDYEPIKKQTNAFKQTRTIGGILLPVVIVVVFILRLFFISSAKGDLCLAIFFISIMGFAGIYFFTSGMALEHLIVYTDGIQHPDRPFNALVSKEHFFIPFFTIEEMYPNNNQGLPYITIKISKDIDKNSRIFKNFPLYARTNFLYTLNKKYIYNLNDFLDLLKEKVKIIIDEDLKIR